MARLACVDIPALPLQILSREHPDWSGFPVAVIAEESLQACVLWVDERARQFQIFPGIRYATALSLSGDLRAGVVRPDEIMTAVRQIADCLRNFSPDVEPSAEEPGVFWLDAEGLNRLFHSPAEWGRAIQKDLQGIRFSGRVVIGFSRYGTYAVARSRVGDAVEPLAFESPAKERETAATARLDRLGLSPDQRDDLMKLGVATLGDFLALPVGRLRERFDEPAAQLHDLASGAAWAPLQPAPPAERLVAGIELEFADDDLPRLLFILKQLLDPLIARLAARREGVRELSLHLRLDPAGVRQEVIRPAQPARSAQPILELVRLRLESSLAGRVEAMEAELFAVSLDLAQADLFSQTPRRDLEAANRALARLRAEFGVAAVARARLCEGHLPEAAFLWEPLERLEGRAGTDETKEREGMSAPLVRRIIEPSAIPPLPLQIGDAGRRPARAGPFVISGGWWVQPIHREYYFTHTQRGEILWAYYDRRRERWFLQGSID